MQIFRMSKTATKISQKLYKANFDIQNITYNGERNPHFRYTIIVEGKRVSHGYEGYEAYEANKTTINKAFVEIWTKYQEDVNRVNDKK